MKKLYFLSCLLLLLSGCSSNSGSKKEVELTVSAAASLQNALNDIKDTYEKDHPNVKINYNFGGSGALQQQISQGAPVDLFFSAAKDQFEKLVKDGSIEKAKDANLLGNDLVLVVPIKSDKKISGFADLRKADKISIGTPEAVPAGLYAKQTLEKLKVWGTIEGKIVNAKDVRQVLTYVETNNVDAGIVYKTDALISKEVRIVATAKENTHAPIIYPVGIIKNSPHSKEARQFYDYLHNDKSLKVFKKYGFTSLIH